MRFLLVYRAYQPPPPPVDPWPKVPAAKPPPEPDWDDEIVTQKESEKPSKVMIDICLFMCVKVGRSHFSKLTFNSFPHPKGHIGTENRTKKLRTG